MASDANATVPETRVDEVSVRHTLQQKLLRSHLVVASIGLLVLVVVLVTLLSLLRETTQFAQVRGPAVRSSNQIRAGVLQSLASLRGWMIVPNSDLKKERCEAWVDIHKNLDELYDRVGSDPAIHKQLSAIEGTLKELKETQWWIEEVAQTPGNEPARFLFEQDVRPVADVIISRS